MRRQRNLPLAQQFRLRLRSFTLAACVLALAGQFGGSVAVGTGITAVLTAFFRCTVASRMGAFRDRCHWSLLISWLVRKIAVVQSPSSAQSFERPSDNHSCEAGSTLRLSLKEVFSVLLIISIYLQVDTELSCGFIRCAEICELNLES